MKPAPTRRQFLLGLGRAVGVAALAGVACRVVKGGGSDPDFVQPSHRYGWQIDPDKCTYCGLCEKSCARQPSAVKAVNDQKKCSNCVACYGHLLDLHTPSDRIAATDKLVCPLNAVARTRLFGGIDGAYRYDINPDLCNGCSKCVRQCNTHGSKSMFLLIRPDLCLGCNECSIARICPSKAVERVPLFPADNFRGDYVPELPT
jgi:electron transport complex protein RnfB